MGSIGGKMFYAHRVIWILQTGRWPTHQIDHVNGNKRDNRFLNIRHATSSENGKNKCVSRANKSGTQGVCWNKRRNKWLAQIQIGGRHIYIGEFIDLEDAIYARKNAEMKHGFHPNHGRNPAKLGK